MKQDGIAVACEKDALFFIAKNLLHLSNFNTGNIIN